ncbi:hypothetical protein DSLASN_10300 [Desulfoluna limicola]|uniref:UspA domain-containing protein n=1 Tax=Desulfoluna limicola TaxID=2810562 RepID=A0ABM7PCZ7_9BACT|nr:hypothetical protein [Desulfoluna limicola]BCS95398.1 hypothetical protein DSLASN_10300 [Desulfoluna limicola]
MNVPKLMVIGTSEPFSHGVADYAIALAQRMGCEILAIHLSDSPVRLTAPLSSLSDDQFTALALEAGVSLSHRSQTGPMKRSLPMLCKTVKRLSLIVADAGLCVEQRHIHPTIPVVEFCTDFKPKSEGAHMTPMKEANRQKGILFKTVVTGIMSVSLYAILFMNVETVMLWFTKGGGYAALPILTALLFSLVHGAFTGNIWSLLGINAKTTPSTQTTQVAAEEGTTKPSFLRFHVMKPKVNV